MAITALTLFRFAHAKDKAWAFGQMQFSRGPLARLPDLAFYKMFGTGTREGFHPYPNWGVYALLISGPSHDWAQEQIHNSDVFRRYRDHAQEAFSIILDPISCRGTWDGQTPFASDDRGASQGKIAFLTRATLKLQHVPAFWRTVPAISASIAEHPDLMLQIGMGEIPWVHQVTFSVWPSMKSMNDFAYNHSQHAEGIKKVRAGDWFKEELFARFAVLAHHGTWHGRDPLTAVAAPAHHSQTIISAARTGGEAAHV